RSDEAAREQQKANQVHPVGVLDWFLAGLDHWDSGDVHAARNDFERALDAEPQSFWPQFFRALVLRRLGKGAQASAAAEQCARLRREFAWSHLLSAYLQFEVGDLNAASKALDGAERCSLEIGARYALLTNRGVLTLKLGQTRLAEDHFQRATLLLPD